MTVSKAFWRIVLKNIGTVVTYTVILVVFGSINMNSNSATTQFEAKKPTVVIFNHDVDGTLAKSFVGYMEKHTEISDEYENDDKLKDALFYETVAVAVDIPENFSADLVAGNNPEIHMQSSAGYVGELAKVSVRRYLMMAQSYASLDLSENELATKVEKALSKETIVEVKSKVDSSKFLRAATYFNFANYSILACVITIICLIMASFNRLPVRKRNLVSAVDIKRMNAVLLRNSCIYSGLMWLFYLVVGFVVVGFDNLWNAYGLLFAINSFVFCVCATCIAYLISKFVQKSGAINGIMNVVALGSSFLCGAFVPAEYLPAGVLTFAHVLPSYYFIDANNKIIYLENFDLASLWPVILNMLIVAAFCVGFAIIANIVSKKKQKIA